MKELDKYCKCQVYLSNCDNVCMLCKKPLKPIMKGGQNGRIKKDTVRVD